MFAVATVVEACSNEIWHARQVDGMYDQSCSPWLQFVITDLATALSLL